ncbi:hypothetical protein PG993_007430 [Apiospora rasikravindrae]|uniref:Uncharacterized protein n=1 Tax=Apiospora rasikravindrae TaxID=990691 RepID=A0ABR1SZA9_9PEZI
MATRPPYCEPMQDDTDALNEGPSPPMSNSPALSSSPMPCLQPPVSTFTPVSMDSENLAAGNTEGGDSDSKACCNTSPENLAAGGSPSTATTGSGSINALIQSINHAAQATTVNKHANNEYDLLSPGDPSSLSSSPQLESATSPADSHANASNSEPSSTRASKAPTTTGPVVERDPSLPVRSSLSIKDFPLSESKNEQSLHHHPNHNNYQPLQSTQQFTPIVKPKPLIRTASTKSTSLVHPSPSSRSRANSYASNIAQLEAKAEKLSMTSSIEDAIRDLHGELKRSDSRRSSILAASVASSAAAPILDTSNTVPISRQVSHASSILETNNAARHGGYSPAGYVMSPNNSLLSNSTTRLRSGSVSKMDTSDAEPAPLARSGPGKTSMRSVRSTSKPPALTGIAELEPTALTAAAMDAADKLEEFPEEEANLGVPPLNDVDRTPNANDYASSSVNDYWDHAYAEAQKQPLRSQPPPQQARPASPSGSTGTFEQAELAFADFDGSHCPPDQEEEEDFQPPLNGIDMSLVVPEDSPGRPRISRPIAPTVRPKSYMDPETGTQMMYYPARVPLMLNLPQKLSKKPKASERNKRRSQVLSTMPEATRQSTNWLPEVIPEPLLDPLGSGSNSNLATPSMQSDSNPLSPRLAESNLDLTLGFPGEAEAQPRPNPQGGNEEARKSRLSMMGLSVMDPSDKRNTRVSNFEALPPQLRASAFFDLPSESPALELKGGSASATLDDILNASAKAPVYAFTDHAFAGPLGHEVYGTEKKRKSHMKRTSSATVLNAKDVKEVKEVKEVKKRSSFFHLRTPSKLSISQTSTKEAKKNAAVDDELDHDSDNERTKLSGSIDGERVAEEDEEDDEEDEEEINEELLYNGPPTTLLAELQMRKHQNKMRTRPIASAYPNGMQSTLLELDTVAETERRNRKGKKVNLAWETPGDDADDDDEDLPLGLVMAKKNGVHDAQAVMAEMNRPLGLMERREQEENEPLSRRQARLQGRNPGPMTQRKTMTSLGGPLGMGGGYGPSPSNSRLDLSAPADDEIEGESLGDRMRRLRAKEEGDDLLPRARPVSMAFTTELFSQLGDTFKEEENVDPRDKGKQRATAPVEEEETLGQRRRRLQAEREAREREMGAGATLNPNMPPPGIMPKLDKRHSLADVLGSNNSSRRVLSDPRMEAERTRQEEASRFRRDQDSKLAALRSQMPQNLSSPQLPRSGAFGAGQFNDGTGGTGLKRHSRVPSFAAPQQATGMGMNGGAMQGGMMGNNYNMAGYGAPTAAYGMQQMPLQMNMMPMGMQQPGQQHDMVDRWRQSIVP